MTNHQDVEAQNPQSILGGDLLASAEYHQVLRLLASGKCEDVF